VNNGAAIMVTDTFSLEEAIFELLKSPVRWELMERSVEYLAKPDSTRNICDMVMKLAKGEI
jgi:processive 1,2-diacylglycerol beta-glucosyltransferase